MDVLFAGCTYRIHQSGENAVQLLIFDGVQIRNDSPVVGRGDYVEQQELFGHAGSRRFVILARITLYCHY